MCLYTDCEQQLMLCVASPLPQKYEENTRICLENGRRCLEEHNHSLLYGRKWCELGQMERLWKTDLFFFFFVPAVPIRHVAWAVIWVYLCDACWRGESRAEPRSADWSFRGNHDEQRAENRPAASDGLICERDYLTPTDLHLSESRHLFFSRWKRDVTCRTFKLKRQTLLWIYLTFRNKQHSNKI